MQSVAHPEPRERRGVCNLISQGGIRVTQDSTWRSVELICHI